MTSTIQNGEGVELQIGTANSHCFDDQILVAGQCIAFASEPWSSKIAASLAREPATADVEREERAFKAGWDKCWCRDPDAPSAVDGGRKAAWDAYAALSRAAPSSEPAIAEGPTQRQVIDAIHTALPRSRWSCSDDESGTKLSLARQRKHSVDTVKALYAGLAQSSTPPASKPVCQYAWCGDGRWCSDAHLPSGMSEALVADENGKIESEGGSSLFGTAMGKALSDGSWQDVVAELRRLKTDDEIRDNVCVGIPHLMRWAEGKSRPRPSVERGLRKFITEWLEGVR